MSETKHTPGPWEADYISDQGWTVLTARGQLITILGDDDLENDASLEADARLIAAAPDLLAHLRFAVKMLSAFPAVSGTAQVEAMRAAVAKAEG